MPAAGRLAVMNRRGTRAECHEAHERRARSLDELAAEFVLLAEQSGEPLLYVPVFRRVARVLFERHAPHPPPPDYAERKSEATAYRVARGLDLDA